MWHHHEELLIELGADQTKHSGRTLFEHLKGVHDLLRDWNAPQHVCLAGLFHSIYGTEVFKHQSLDDRKRLQAATDKRTEALVHAFCVAKDRPLFESIEDKTTRRQLQEIEAANILEQGGSGKTLRKLMSSKISRYARAALEMELARR